MKLTELSQTIPTQSASWYNDPHDPQAIMRVYQQELVPAYDYPAFSVNARGELVPDPQANGEQYQAYQLQICQLSKRLSDLAILHSNFVMQKLNKDNLSSVRQMLMKFLEDINCGFTGKKTSKYASQEAIIFKEIKYNLEVIINHILKNEDRATLVDLIQILGVCEAGVYLETKRLKEQLTRADGVQAYLLKRRVALVDVIVQNMIVYAQLQNKPIKINYHTHFSKLIGQVLQMSGASLPVLAVKDPHIPYLIQDPRDPSRIIFKTNHDKNLALSRYNFTNDDIKMVVELYERNNNAIDMIEALASDLIDEVKKLYAAYLKTEQAHREAAGIKFVSAVNELLGQYKMTHLTLDSFISYDEFDYTKAITLKSDDNLCYYFVSAVFLMFHEEKMADEIGHTLIHENYTLWHADGLVTTITEESHGIHTIMALEDIPADTLLRLPLIINFDTFLVARLKSLHPDNERLQQLFTLMINLHANLITIKNNTYLLNLEEEADYFALLENLSVLTKSEIKKVLMWIVDNDKINLLWDFLLTIQFTEAELSDVFSRIIYHRNELMAYDLFQYLKENVDGYSFNQSDLRKIVTYDMAYALKYVLMQEGADAIVNQKSGPEQLSLLEFAVKLNAKRAILVILNHSKPIMYQEASWIGGVSYHVFAYTHDAEILHHLIALYKDSKPLRIDDPLFNRPEITDINLVRKALIYKGAPLLRYGYLSAPTFIVSPEVLIRHKLIASPKKLAYPDKIALIHYLAQHQDTLGADIQGIFLKILVLSGFDRSPERCDCPDALLDLLMKKRARLDKNELFAHPRLHTLVDFLGFERLCVLANVSLNSNTAFRLYAKSQYLRYAVNSTNPQPQIADAFMKVVKARTNQVTQLLSQALTLIRPSYSRFYLYSAYRASADPIDMPEEMISHLRLS